MLTLASRVPSWAAAAVAASGAMGVLTVAALFVGPVPPLLFALPAVAAVAVAWGPAAGALTALWCLGWLNLSWLQPSGLPSLRPTVGGAAVFVGVTAALIALIESRVHSWRGADPAAMARRRGAVLLLTLAVLLPTAVFAVVAQRTHEQAFASARLRVDRASRIIREHAGKVMDINDVLIGRIEDLVRGLSDDEIRRREAELQPRIAAFTARLPQSHSVWLWDREGHLLLTDRGPVRTFTALDVSDRSYFRWHAEHRGGLFVSEPLQGRATRQPFFDVSRARGDDSASHFDGVISVALRPAFFEHFYAELVREEPGLSVTLIRQDGTLLVRWPAKSTLAQSVTPDGQIKKALEAGSREGLVTMRSAFDDQERLIAFHAVDGYPLYAASGLAVDGVLRAWRQDMALFALFFFPMAGALVLATGFAVRRAHREHDAMLRLRGEVEHRVKAERALVNSQKLEALGQLTGSVAHDFNNLLAVISNNAFLIERQTSIEKIGPLAAAIRRAVTTGTQLTRQLLAFSRHQPVRPQDVDLDEVLPNVVELLRTTVGSHIQVALHLANDLWPVRVDLAEFELALINLALNARHAMPQGGRLTVIARNAAPGDVEGLEGRAHVVISVSDTGTGIASDVLERVFEPFFTTKPEGQGSGLGLSQVYGTCSQVGGTARIESHLGLGTTVVMVLPAADHHAKSTPAPRAPNEPLNCRLLLVEDNPEVAQATLSLLGAFGVQGTRAADADEALQMLRSRAHGFDIVLTDVVMPGELNGLTLAQRLRAEQPTLPVVLMTGYTSEIHKALAAGFQVLPKPFVPEDLINTLALARQTAVPLSA